MFKDYRDERVNNNFINEKINFYNYELVFTIGDIHGDFDKFVDILTNIGKDKRICRDNVKNIFYFYDKTIYGEKFKLCKILKNNIKNDNFVIVQLGDIMLNTYKKVYYEENKELEIILLISSLINSFKIIRKRCKYIQLLGNHDCVMIYYNKRSSLSERFKKLKLFKNNGAEAYRACNKIKYVLFNNSYITCKINNNIYSHYFFSLDSLNYILNKYYLNFGNKFEETDFLKILRLKFLIIYSL